MSILNALVTLKPKPLASELVFVNVLAISKTVGVCFIPWELEAVKLADGGLLA